MVLKQIKSISSTASRAQGMGKKAKKQGSKFGMAVILYCLIFSLILSLNTLWHLIPTFTAPSKYLLTFTISLLIGIIHLNKMYENIEWAEDESYFKELGFTLLIAVFALLITYSLVKFLILPGYAEVALYVGMAYFGFSFPYLWSKAARFARLIPEKIHSYWDYPKHPIEPSSEWERDKFVYANLIFTKSLEDPIESTVKVRLPLDAKFGELIYMFVEDYNERRNPEFPIVDLHNSEGTLKWYFKAKKRFGTEAIDPEMTVAANKLRDEQIIYFGRVIAS
jgi:hypothetical protein